MKKKLLSLIAVALVIGSFATMVSATSMNSRTSTTFTTASSARDVDGKYSFTQGTVTWSGKAQNAWPAGYIIYYAPYSQDNTQCGNFIGLSSRGASGGQSYWSGKGYKANYRVGSYTSTSSVDTTFSFFE